ncbi:hypothetical protein [Ekhidna sp.]|uniref:hypothetical protein n=1 Tax=Ekhidna sp. TaxID=2608089 RepID=UPI003296D7B2
MKKLFFVRILTAVLTISMVTEIAVPLNVEDAISIEIDSETENEEGKEDNKEKTTSRLESYLPETSIYFSNLTLISFKHPKWKSPSIDFQTPPPELS